MNGQLLKSTSPLALFARYKSFKDQGGVRYPGGIRYFPRHPDQHKDPEYTPTKLFRVERIKPAKNNAWWLKDILKEMKIDEENRVAIVKNIPEQNAKLWKVKHLVKITPITFPYGEPTMEDIKHTVLLENGQCIVTKTLKLPEENIQALEQFDSDKKKMDSTTLKKDSRYKWNVPYAGGF